HPDRRRRSPPRIPGPRGTRRPFRKCCGCPRRSGPDLPVLAMRAWETPCLQLCETCLFTGANRVKTFGAAAKRASNRELAQQDVLEHHPVGGEGVQRVPEGRGTVLLEEKV